MGNRTLEEIAGRIALLASGGRREPNQLLLSIFHHPTVGICICDDQLRFQAVNDTLADMNGFPAQEHIGKSIFDILGGAAAQVAQAFEKVLRSGAPLEFELSAILPTRKEIGYWAEYFFPISDDRGRVKQLGATVLEITKQRKLEESFHALALKLLKEQDEQQRRIARELHDSINQYHSAILMNLRRLRQPELQPMETKNIFQESMDLLEQCMSETRTISYLLHPPQIGERGFAAAAQWYAKGFAQRSGIEVQLDLPQDIRRLPEQVEVTLYRILQETLSNVHRHANARMVKIHVTRVKGHVVMEVQDDGRGMSPELVQRIQDTGGGGLGFASIQERLRELGGFLEIDAGTSGTVVRVSTPVDSLL